MKLENLNLFSDSEWIAEILDISNIGFWFIKIDMQRKTEEMYGNATMLRLLGLEGQPDPRECYRHWYGRIDKNHIYRVTNVVKRMIETGQQYEVQYPWMHPKFGQLFVRCGGKTRPSAPDTICLGGYHQDVTGMENIKKELKNSLQQLSKTQRQTEEIERLKEHYQHLAYIDMLTALPNRRSFFEMGENFIRRYSDEPRSYWVIIVDIDRFKQVNDTYGHAAGDIVLHEIARRFKESLQDDSEFIGRIGGEEFAIFLLEADEKNAYGVAERLRAICMDEAYELEDGMRLSVTCSFGLARMDVSAEKSSEEFLREALHQADIALYKAKNSGRNQSIIFRTEMQSIRRA